MDILVNIVDSINQAFENRNNEAGGILGGEDNRITQFQFDRECSTFEYIPDIVNINTRIKEWYEQGIKFVGIIHSHKNNDKLSYADIQYARDILQYNRMNKIYMMLYVMDKKEIILYKVLKNNIEDEIINVL